MTGVDVLRLVYGSVLVVKPDVLVGCDAGSASDERLGAVVRVLGARHVVQAVVASAWPTRHARRVGAAVDGLHALTGAAFARLDANWRRAALLDAAIAVAFGAANIRLADGGGGR